MPGTLESLKQAFFPKGGLVAQQKTGAGTYGSGRVADLSPGLATFKRRPLVGQGYGTRITQRSDPKVNAPILDDQWLAFGLETGALGVLALLWLFGRAVRRLGSVARRDAGLDGWRAATLAAAICGFAAGMVTYDAFEFIQVTIVVFLLLGLAAADLAGARA
jgi:O-antigen ligase